MSVVRNHSYFKFKQFKFQKCFSFAHQAQLTDDQLLFLFIFILSCRLLMMYETCLAKGIFIKKIIIKNNKGTGEEFLKQLWQRTASERRQTT